MIEISELVKTYQKENEQPVRAIDNVSLTIEKGEFVAILGPSGSGKSTLMNVLGLLDRPDSGSYRLNNQPVLDLGDKELAKIRNEVIGFVFQSYHLLPRTTAIENVQLPLLYSGRKNPGKLSEEALESVGLANRMKHYTNELSGGQQQRVAIARAIVNKPSVIFADEPTGNLDTKASAEILELFEKLNNDMTTIVLITHDLEVAKKAKRVITVRDGNIVSDELNQAATGALS